MQFGDAFEREVLAVERNQHRVGGDERVQREQSERRRRVDEDVVEVGAQRIEQTLQTTLAAVESDELDLGAGELAVGGKKRERVDAGREDERSRVGIVRHQRAVGAALAGATLQADAAREVGLRIHVDEQDALFGQRERRAEIDGGRGFGDAALLIGDGDDLRIIGHYTDLRVVGLTDCVPDKGRCQL